MMAKALISAGAQKVYIVGRRVDVLQSAAAQLNKPGSGVIIPLYCDVTSKISLESIVSVVENDSGYLNLLVCNAGIGGPPSSPTSIVVDDESGKTTTTTVGIDEFRARQMEGDFEDFHATFKVNASSVWFTSMAFLGLLDRGNKRSLGAGDGLLPSSQVIVTSSIAGFNKAAPGGWAYGASKAAATHLAKSLSLLLPTWGIRANCICPGLFPSDMAAPIVRAAGGGDMDMATAASSTIPIDKTKVPLGRMGDGLDMAGQILYLASRAGAYCNGNTILVDGGRLGTMSSYGY
ncbi:NAD(P)-binding protein [Rhypophila decipiens]|uniref:NAD(P)-binding protein n=1 Tax=Rhypophila decipiens TaxID=261697 RepID=A0AAN7BDI0_9PEZI|nr:NAD(P)-binding protein [Rhypophila decipiens]